MSAAKTDTLKSLPDDVEALKRIIVDQLNVISEKEKTLAEKDHIISVKEQRIAVLEEFVRLQKLKQFCARTEKSADQQEMFNEAELSVVAEAVLAEQDADRDTQSAKPPQPKTRAGRKPLQAGIEAQGVARQVSTG